MHTHTHQHTHIVTHHTHTSLVKGNIFQLYTNRTLLSLVLYNFSISLSVISHTLSSSFFCIKLANHKIICVEGGLFKKKTFNNNFVSGVASMSVSVCLRHSQFPRLPSTARSVPVPVSVSVHGTYPFQRVCMSERPSESKNLRVLLFLCVPCGDVQVYVSILLHSCTLSLSLSLSVSVSLSLSFSIVVLDTMQCIE
jgi:hypothetical protein